VADDAAELETEVSDLETRVLSSLYRKERGTGNAWRAWSVALGRARVERRELQSRIYEASLERPHELILAIYSENKSLLLEMLTTYRRLAESDGEVTAVDYFLPATRTKSAKAAAASAREKAADLKKFFAAPPENLLGLAMKEVSITEMAARVLPWVRAGFAVMITTGILLVYAIPVRTYQSVWFRAKVIFLILAFINIWYFHARVLPHAAEWDHDVRLPKAARRAGIASIVLWGLIIIAGRFIAYNWFDCAKRQSPLISTLAGCTPDMIDPYQ
jgi:hypothetical protein